MNHGTVSPIRVFRYTIIATNTSVPALTTTHQMIELAMASAGTGLLDAAPGCWLACESALFTL